MDESDIAARAEVLKGLYIDKINQLQFLIDWLDAANLLPDHCFSFPDGETWYVSGQEPAEYKICPVCDTDVNAITDAGLGFVCSKREGCLVASR